MTKQEYEAKVAATAEAIRTAHWVEGGLGAVGSWEKASDENRRCWLAGARAALAANGINPPKTRWETEAERIIDEFNTGKGWVDLIASALKAEAERVRDLCADKLRCNCKESSANIIEKIDLSE